MEAASLGQQTSTAVFHISRTARHQLVSPVHSVSHTASTPLASPTHLPLPTLPYQTYLKFSSSIGTTALFQLGTGQLWERTSPGACPSPKALDLLSGETTTLVIMGAGSKCLFVFFFWFLFFLLFFFFVFFFLFCFV